MWIAAISVVAGVVILVVVFLLKGQSGGQPQKPGKGPEQKDTEFIQRLSYLMKIVMEHSSADRRESSTREVIRIGEAIHEQGGFRYMIKIHEAVTKETSPKVGTKLKVIWKGIGDWRA